DKLTDSLALYDVLAAIDPQLPLASMTAILDAGSNLPANSLRTVLGRLLDVFRFQGAGSDLPGAGTDRQSYFAGLLQLESLLASMSSPFALRSLAGMDAQTLLGLARSAEDGMAYRYALAALNPFALLGADYSAYAGELQLFDPAAGSGALTERWLADRAGFLAAVNFRNTHDLSDSQRVVQGGAPLDYAAIDAEGNRTILRGAAGASDSVQIVFGGSADDSLQGNGAADHLYGGDGADTLEGREGADYLEGGRGADQLAGGSGDDTLAGGDGDDVLTGGAGNDLLEGGSGRDIYRYATGEGADIISDSDGLGAIIYDGVTLAGGAREAGGVYWDETRTIRYAFAGNPAQGGTLEVNGSIAIRNFRNGDLGITLENLEAPAAAEGSFDHSYLEGPFLRGPDGFFSEVDGYGSAGNDLFVGTDDARSLFFGKAGDDIIVAAANANGEAAFLTGGSGDDRITGAASGIDFSALPASDIPLLAGGAGRDRIEGSADPEALFGDLFRVIPYAGGSTVLSLDALTVVRRSATELAGTWWSGPLGVVDGTYASAADAIKRYLGVTADTDLAHYYDDTIDAGAGDDYLVGGTGSDTLIGGEGDDTLVADVWAYDYVPRY
ncbi:MAG: hypothetical protein HYU75_20925, partial [Betaproteobacteria bacterium]|nr:hypothetical protein [Betaproteobacteria bacterium]